MARQLTGRVTLIFNGKQRATLYGTAKLNPGGKKRTPQVCDDGSVSYTEQITNSVCTAEIAATAGLDVKEILESEACTLRWLADNGLAYIVKDALAQEVGEISDGKISVTFFGCPAEKI